MPLRAIFLGRSGIRAGWSIAIFALVLSAGLVARSLLLKSLAPVLGAAVQASSSAPSLFMLAKEGSLALLILGATVAMAKIENRSPWSYGLAYAHPRRDLATGFVAGFAFLSVLVGLLALSHSLVFDGLALRGGAILGFGLYWTGFDFIVGWVEEALFRGYLQSTLARGMGFWPAAACTAVAFGLAHAPNPGEDLLGITAVIVAGIFFSLCVRLTGSLWWGIGFHGALDWSEDFFYCVANSGHATAAGRLFATHPVGPPSLSGGADGPEGSLIAVALMVVLNVAVGVAVAMRRASARVSA